MRRASTLVVVPLVIAMVSWPASATGAGLVAGELGRWLDEQAAPALTRELAHHPRFRGETIAFAVPDSRLAEALAERLAGHLRREPGIRIALPGEGTACAPVDVPPYRILVEVRESDGDHRVTVAVADLDERTWVGGLSLAWEGSLARAQREALAEPAAQHVADRLTPAETSRIAAALAAAASCRFPTAPPVAVHLERPRADDARLDRLGKALGAALTDRAWQLTDDADAPWRLRLVRDAHTGGSTLQLLAIDREHGTSQVVARTELAPEPPAPEALLGSIAVEAGGNKGVCRDTPRGCARVDVALVEPAWLVVFSTASGEVKPLACEAPKRAGTGERSYRLRVPTNPTPARPGAALYVVASRDRALAERLAELVASAPRACPGAIANPHWFETFERTVAAHSDRIDWRAVHLRDDAGHLTRL